MSQHDFEIANQGFPATRADLNNALQALASNSAGTSEPSTTYAYQFWYDDTNDLLKLRNSDNDAWITLAAFDQTNDEWEVRSAVIQAVDSAGVSIKTDDGTTRVSIADDGSVTINTSLDVDNIKIDGNSITSTDTNGDINITPDGLGKVVLDGLNYPTADGTDGQVLTTDGSGNIAFEDVGGGLFQSYAVVQDQKSSTTDGGTFTSGAFRTRDLNTEVFDPDGIVSLSSNQFTLQAGTYFIRWSAPAFFCQRHVTELFNITDSTSDGIGSTEFCNTTDGDQNRSIGSKRLTITGAKAFEIRHRCQTTATTNGFGVSHDFAGTGTVYTIVEIFKEA